MASGAAAAAPKSDVAVVGVGDHTHAVNPARGRSQASPALRGYDSRKTALTTYNAPVATASEFDKVSVAGENETGTTSSISCLGFRKLRASDLINYRYKV